VPEWLPGRGAWSWDLCCGSPSWLPCPGSSVPLCSGLTLALNTSLSSSNLALVCSGTPSVLILLASRAVTNTAFPGSKGCAESPGTSANRAALCGTPDTPLAYPQNSSTRATPASVMSRNTVPALIARVRVRFMIPNVTGSPALFARARLAAALAAHLAHIRDEPFIADA
jgi:hypothetical protein